MTEEKRKELLNKYPYLLIAGDPEGGSYSWLDDLPRGWRNAFAEEMFSELDTILKEDNITDFAFEEIKEKYGRLVMYYHPYTERLDRWESKYENMSTEVCAGCGNPATRHTRGWVVYLCDNCEKQLSETWANF